MLRLVMFNTETVSGLGLLGLDRELCLDESGIWACEYCKASLTIPLHSRAGGMESERIPAAPWTVRHDAAYHF